MWNVREREEPMMIPRTLGRTMRGAGVGQGNQKLVSGSNKFEKTVRQPSRDVTLSVDR